MCVCYLILSQQYTRVFDQKPLSQLFLSVTNSTSVRLEIEMWIVLLGWFLWLAIYTKYARAISHTLTLRKFYSGKNNTYFRRETDSSRGFLAGCCYLKFIHNSHASDLPDSSPDLFLSGTNHNSVRWQIERCRVQMFIGMIVETCYIDRIIARDWSPTPPVFAYWN